MSSVLVLATFLIDVFLLNPAFLMFPTSMMAANALYIALKLEHFYTRNEFYK